MLRLVPRLTTVAATLVRFARPRRGFAAGSSRLVALTVLALGIVALLCAACWWLAVLLVAKVL